MKASPCAYHDPARQKLRYIFICIPTRKGMMPLANEKKAFTKEKRGKEYIISDDKYSYEAD